MGLGLAGQGWRLCHSPRRPTLYHPGPPGHNPGKHLRLRLELQSGWDLGDAVPFKHPLQNFQEFRCAKESSRAQGKQV